jgi:hypothetical protein
MILRNALCAHESFASFCFPLFLEKMSSTSYDAKMDAMDTLCFVAESYGAEVLRLFFSDIWLALRHEVSFRDSLCATFHIDNVYPDGLDISKHGIKSRRESF